MICKYTDWKGSAAMLASLQSAGVTPEVNLRITQVRKQAIGIHPGLKPRADVTTNQKQWYQWPTKRTCILQRFYKEQKESSVCQSVCLSIAWWGYRWGLLFCRQIRFTHNVKTYYLNFWRLRMKKIPANSYHRRHNSIATHQIYMRSHLPRAKKVSYCEIEFKPVKQNRITGMFVMMIHSTNKIDQFEICCIDHKESCVDEFRARSHKAILLIATNSQLTHPPSLKDPSLCYITIIRLIWVFPK